MTQYTSFTFASLFKYSCLAFAVLLSGAPIAQASETAAANALHYSCEGSANYFSVNSLDYMTDNEPLRQKDGLFFNSSRNDKPQAPSLVADCQVADHKMSLARVFLNVPDLSGKPCATLDWAVFQIKANDKLISEFISGCSDEIHFFTTRFNIHICKSDFNQTVCRSLPWQKVGKGNFTPIRIGLFGEWL